jgi:ferredoxin
MNLPLLCNCNRTTDVDGATIGRALGTGALPVHQTLCRREVGAALQAIDGHAQAGAPLLVGCTQEAALFSELADERARHHAAQGKPAVAPVAMQFVNLREAAGWGRAAHAAPEQTTAKMAALLALARAPEPEPMTQVSYHSQGRLAVIGTAEQAARVWPLLALADVSTTWVVSGGPASGQAAAQVAALGTTDPVDVVQIAGEAIELTGWLGAFTLKWSQANPIDLDLCTRCGACVAACPESAISWPPQVNLGSCQSHRACVAACDAAGAINFQREPTQHEAAFDLVIDLRPTPAFGQHAHPQGYLHLPTWGDAAAPRVVALAALVGTFDKPKFFAYRQKLCAHSRNQQPGCTACIDVCSAQAIASDLKRQQIVVTPQLCVGCGACTTVCPTGAISYRGPQPSDQVVRIRTLLDTFARAGGQAPVLLLHDGTHAAPLLQRWGRAAQGQPLAGRGPARPQVAHGTSLHGPPPNVLPLALWHMASAGLELWWAALLSGARRVVVLSTQADAPTYRQALADQMAQGQAVLNGLGFAGEYLHLISVDEQAPDAVVQLDTAVRAASAPVPPTLPEARFAITNDKRAALELALVHLIEHAPALRGSAAPVSLPLPAAAPIWGTLHVDAHKCTTCLSCVSACPAGALMDTPDRPALRFIEKNCVQCGLCQSTCPEDAIALQPRLLLDRQRREPRVLHESRPWACIRCSKPFGTVQAIEAMLGKLAGHAMFQGDALERLKMCSDCRVVDIYSNPQERRIIDGDLP